MATRKPKKKQARAPRGQVGPQTYEQVRKIADEKKIPLVKAFAEVAKATGRKACGFRKFCPVFSGNSVRS